MNLFKFENLIHDLLGIGDWGLGIGDWGLGIGPNPQSPIPNPQSPIPIFLRRNGFILFLIFSLMKQLFEINNKY